MIHRRDHGDEVSHGRSGSTAQRLRCQGKGAPLSLPRCTSEAMALHLEEIARAVAPGAHAVVLLDQAGWHTSAKLPVPGNITLLPLPPKSPELNPVESIWRYMRGNRLPNRIFASSQDIMDHCCYAWNALLEPPWTIMSIGLRADCATGRIGHDPRALV